jgi:hypothetical protein
LFVLAGISLFVSGLLGGGVALLIVTLAIAGGIPVAYSYFLYRRLEGFKNGAGKDTSQSST